MSISEDEKRRRRWIEWAKSQSQAPSVMTDAEKEEASRIGCKGLGFREEPHRETEQERAEGVLVGQNSEIKKGMDYYRNRREIIESNYQIAESFVKDIGRGGVLDLSDEEVNKKVKEILKGRR